MSPPDESVRLWQDILEDDPSDLFARWGLLRDAAERGRDAESVRHLCAIADTVPSRSDAAHLLQEAAERSLFAGISSSEQAEKWERVAELAPERTRGWMALLELYIGDAENDAFIEFCLGLKRRGMTSCLVGRRSG